MNLQTIQNNSLRKLAPGLALCVAVQGCVGGGVLKSRTETFQDPVLPDIASPALYPRDTSTTTNTMVYTAAWLQAHWGKPAKVAEAGAGDPGEIWTYSFRSIWEGIAVVAVIPIKLALPVKKEKVQFVLHDGRVISATQITPRAVGGVVGCSVGPCGPVFGAFPLEGFLQ